MQDATRSISTLQRENEHQRRMIAELLTTITALRSDNQQLRERLDWLSRQHFGRRSERVNPNQPLLFAEPEPAPPSPEPDPPPVEITVKRTGHGRRSQSNDLPRERMVLDLTEAEKTCPCCGAQRVKIGSDVSSRHDYRPASVFIREIERPTYLCRHCEQQGENVQAIQAPLPAEPIARGTVAAGLLAHVLVSKWFDHLPLYRLESILNRQGWSVSRSTLCDQMMTCAEVLTPLYELMCRRVRQSWALHTDDTHLTLLDPRRTGHAWVYVGDAMNPYTVFDLSPGRQQEYPATFLDGYRGYIHADGYAGYNPLYAAGAQHVGCWMHARRKFFDAKDGDAVKAHNALARIRGLYAVESQAKEQNLTGDARADYRREHAGPLLQSFADWLAEEIPRALPKSKIGEAFGYASNQWQSLTRYVDDGRLTIDNAPAEQAIRPLAVGRRNWLHIAGDGGMTSAAVLLSIAASAKRHAVRAWDYVKHILTQSAGRSRGNDFSDLLPDVWAAGKS